MSAPAPLEDCALRDQAVDWKVRLQSGDASPADWETCRRWRAADPAHERAWERLHGISQLFQQLPPPLTRSTLARADRDTTRAQRRTVLKSLLLVGGCAGATAGGWSAYRWLPWQDLVADHHTAIGEQRLVMLDDRSRLTLNTNSAVKLGMEAVTRDIALLRGEILLRLAGAHPVRVRSAQGWVEAGNGRFSVRQDTHATRVSVYEGDAQVVCRDGMRGHLKAGQQACFTEHDIRPATPLADSDGAWADGVLVAQGMRLADFVEELGRYRHGIVRCAAALADLRISGVFPLADTDHALDAVTRVLPVAVQRHTRFWVTLIAA